MKWIDSNIFLRYWNGQEIAKTFVSQLKLGTEKYHISPFVIIELEWVMRSFYKETKTDIVEFVESILAIDNLVVEKESDVQKAMVIFEKNNIKLVDAIIAELMHDNDVIVSFDRDFDKLSNIKRVEPQDLVG